MSDNDKSNGDSVSTENATTTITTAISDNEVTESHENSQKNKTVSPQDSGEDQNDTNKNVSSNGEDEKEEEEEEEGDAIDDLFGDDDEEDEEKKDLNNNNDDDEDEDDVTTNRRRRIDMDEEEEMYTRKFYGEDVNNLSDLDDNEHHHFKEQDVELVRHMVPYKVTSGKNTEEEPIYYAKVPAFLMIDPIAFDPPTFEEKVKTRLSDGLSSKEDQVGERLIDENTVRWRYSRDSNQKVFRESNTQIIQWSDGSYSLKVGDEYTDILVNDTDNTFLTVSHDEQELMQCVDGGEVKKTLMLIPTSTTSKIHNRLSRAVARRAQRETTGPGTYLINVDPEIEKEELEKKQQQIMRERRRRRQAKERESLESPDTTIGSQQAGAFGRRSAAASHETRRGREREDEYEEDDFLVDDDEDEEFNSDIGGDEEEEEEEEEEEQEDEAAEEAEERARAARLAQTKRGESAMSAGSETQEEESQKRRRVAVISDDEEE